MGGLGFLPPSRARRNSFERLMKAAATGNACHVITAPPAKCRRGRQTSFADGANILQWIGEGVCAGMRALQKRIVGVDTGINGLQRRALDKCQ
eukprot:m.386957 g.386957  ORF g.386957 m.386957 type:complete len:93 (-) comp21026_c0_seq7:2303-2581(-)